MTSGIGHDGAAKLFLGSTAAVKAAQNDGASLLFLASQMGHSNVPDYPITHTRMQTSARRMKSAGPRCALRAALNSAPPHKGHLEVLLLLLAGKADIAYVCKNGNTALSVATKDGNDGAARLLQEHTARVGTTTPQ